MAIWFVVTKRKTCPDCYGTGKQYDPNRVLAYGSMGEFAKSAEYQGYTCKTCDSKGYLEEEVDLREAVRYIMQEAINADNQ